MPKSTIKILGFIGLGIISFFIAAILYFFIYYTWQLKYGSQEAVGSIVRSLDGSFTQISQDEDAPPPRTDWETFVRKENPTWGNSDAAVTIVMFIDFECPYCQASFPIFNEVMDTFGNAIRVVMKHFPIESIHPSARNTAEASMCAHAQGQFWEFYNRAFVGKNLDESSLYAYAVESSVNASTFDRCYKAKTYSKTIEADLSDGVVLGVRGTPTYMVNGQFFEGVATIEQWKKIIVDALNQQ